MLEDERKLNGHSGIRIDEKNYIACLVIFKI